MMHKYDYRWTLKDADFTKDKGKVFSCFACGGGSSMGYKLAGFDVIGCNEIDHRMMYTYCQNHNPHFPFLEPIQTFKEKNDLPPELFNLDILDGSPPCSTFSIAGSREDAWGKMKHFREGQAEQVLDTLFFDFIDLAKRLQPKVVVAENVKGLLLGEAKNYVRRIYDGFEDAGYYCQHWLLDAQKMGVPQRRERVFFVCLRKDIAAPFLVSQGLFDVVPALNLDFNEKPIMFGEVADFKGREAKSKTIRLLWDNRQKGDLNQGAANERLFGKGSNFNQTYVYLDRICPTLASKESCLIHFEQPRFLGQSEVCCISSFPQDYNFAGQPPHYVCGMSVPPVMMAQIASRIWEYWLSKI
jgi:DNA (cytosine-5)-methyltransferase 1